MTHILSIDSSLSEVAKSKDGLLHIFQCYNDPGMCDDWDADSGGNICIVSSSQVEPQPKQSISVELDHEISSREEFYNIMSESDFYVGVSGDTPIWMQYDETPICKCNHKMQFVAQIEDISFKDFSFGDGGCAYIYECVCCGTAKFLWQC